MASALPPSLRFVDYFFQTGLAPDTNLLERRVVDCEDDGSVVKEPASTISTPQIGTHVDTSYESVKFDMVELTPTTDSEPPSPFSAQAGSTITSSPPRKSFEGRTTVTSKASSQLDPATMTPCATKMKRRHPIEYRYQPDVLCRYPAEDYPDNGKFPQYLSMFCFPNDITLKYEPDGPPASTFHSFIITEESGSKNYGVCVTIYEKLHPNLFSQLEAAIEDWRELTAWFAQSDLEYMQHIQSQLATNQETILRLNRGMVGDPRNPDADPADVLAEAEEKVALYKELLSPMKSMLVDVESIYVPRCLGLLSHWPWHDVFNDWLRELIKVVTGNYEDVETRALATYAPLERCLVNLFHEVPLPPPGRVELCINIGQMRLFCSRPPVNTVQVLQNFSLYPVFRTLSIQSIITLFELGLTEKKIIFLSSHCSMLTLACETLCLLLYPLSWQHILIPVLPSRLLSYLQAPMPYIIGVQREYFTRAQEEEWRPHDAALIDLDNNTIDVPMMLPTIPLRDRKKLQARLSKYAGNNGVSLASSTSPTSGIKEQMKGVPITVKYAYPNGVLVPFSNLSKRWINAEMELAARNSAAAAASHRHTKGHADRRASYESVHEKSAAPGTQTNSPASAVSFFTKFNKSVTGTLHTNNSSSESFTSSLDTLNASFIPVSATPLVSVHNESALTGPEEEETDQFDEDMLDRSRKAQIDQVRRRTRSATPEYGDPNTLPPLALWY
ncbi:AEX-3 domain-containing protein [Chytridium lagenaria]|nr:AEX-3 domain-containing protein [Chytridium lagenaria]